MKLLATSFLVILALCIACADPTPSFEAFDASAEVRELDIEITNVEVRVPTNGQGGCAGTALLSLSRNGRAVLHTKPVFAALVPGLEAGVLSTELERTDERGVIPIKFRTSGFPFDVLVRLPTSETELVRIDFDLPDAGTCGDALDGGPADAGAVDGGATDAGPSDAGSEVDGG